MNSRHTFLITSLLSVVPFFSYANDLHYYNELSDLGYASRFNRIETSDKNIQAALVYLLAGQVPPAYNCSFKPVDRIQKICIKEVINNNLIHNSFDIVIDLPDSAQLSLLSTDQILEIGYVAAQDLLAKKSLATVGIDAGKTLVREKLVEAVLWLVEQTHIEDLLPESVTDSYVYEQTVIELTRFYTDLLLKKITK